MLRLNMQMKERSIKKLQLPISNRKIQASVENKNAIKKQQAQIKQQYNQRPKILKINDLINKNICMRKQINLTDVTNIQQKSSRKKKLDISLSRQKAERERSISERSANKSTKLKVSIGRHQSIRKIKSFQVTQQQQQNVQRIKNHRAIQALQKNGHDKQNSTNTINNGDAYHSVGQTLRQVQKRKIKLYRK